jgi:DNA-binding SARP family transcriptional activator
MLRFRLLGPVELVMRNGHSMALSGARRRALLAVLLVNAGTPVTKAQLFDELWGAQAPSHADNALHALVARLRKQVAECFGTSYARDRLITCAAGYVLDAEPGDVDAAVFCDLVGQSQRLLPGKPAEARELITKALSLWRGPALQGATGGALLRASSLQYEEHRLAAIEISIEAGMAVGQYPEAISELRKAACLYPWREKLTDLLMLSLYRSGRQAEAMEAYTQARARLVEELGMEPSPLLRARARAILTHDPSLLNTQRIVPASA